MHVPRSLRLVLIATACSFVALAVRYALDPWLGSRQPFTPAFAAVAVSAWYGTWRAGLLCAVLSHLWANYFFVSPRNTLSFSEAEVVGAGSYYLIAGVLLYLGHRATEATRLLQMAVERLQVADTRKSELLAFVAHEVRTPLSAITSALGILKKKEAATQEQRRRALGVAERQAANISRLAADLLDVARIRQGKVTLNLGPCALPEVIAAAADAVAPQMEKRNQHLRLSVPDEFPLVQADEIRLQQALINLMHNASKFSPDGAEVFLTLSQERQTVRIRVADHGVGIPSDKLEWVFDSFTQVHPGGDGLGMGLALVRKLVELHGGSISATSDGLGHGSAFEICLPVHEDGLPAAPDGPSRGLAARPSEGVEQT